MPKEVIRTISPSAPDTEFSVKVGWSKEAEYVDIATFRADGVLALKDDKGKLQEIETIETPGWVVSLSRSQINRLIKSLRVARDQAFGRDE